MRSRPNDVKLNLEETHRHPAKRRYADMPISPPENGRLIDPTTRFEWDAPARILMPGVQPPQLPSFAATDVVRVVTGRSPEALGRWNNCDVYIVAPPDWNTTIQNAEVVVSLFVIVQGTPYPVAGMLNRRVQTLPGRVENPDGSFRAYALAVRGRPCDGFRVAVSVQHGGNTGTTTPVAFSEGQVMIFAWGEETSSNPSGSIIIPPASPPLLSSAPQDLVGVATVTKSPISADSIPLVQGLQLSAEVNNTNAIGVSFHAATGGSSQFLAPGDSIYIPASDANLVYVQSVGGSQNWGASLYA